MKLADLDRLVAAPDRLDWRLHYDPDTEQWEAWFHPDWQADPIRVALAEADGISENEQACIAAFQAIIAHAPALLRVAKAARKWVATQREYEAWHDDESRPASDGDGIVEEMDAAHTALQASLAALEAVEPPR